MQFISDDKIGSQCTIALQLDRPRIQTSAGRPCSERPAPPCTETGREPRQVELGETESVGVSHVAAVVDDDGVGRAWRAQRGVGASHQILAALCATTQHNALSSEAEEQKAGGGVVGKEQKRFGGAPWHEDWPSAFEMKPAGLHEAASHRAARNHVSVLERWRQPPEN